jgi:hypothetical protein
MPGAQACVCVYCGATVGSRRGLRMHVRKLHAQADALGVHAALPYAKPPGASAAAAVSPAAMVLRYCKPASEPLGLGSGPHSGRIVAPAVPIFRIQTSRALSAPPPDAPATLHFTHVDPSTIPAPMYGTGTSDETLGHMQISFLLNPV